MSERALRGDAAPGGASAGMPVPFRGGGFQPQPRRLVPVAVFAVIIGAWQLASSLGWLPALFMPSPWQIVGAFGDMIDNGTLGKHVGASLLRITSGWFLGTVAGLAIGLAMGLFSIARAGGLPVVSALFPIPKIALLPLFILWFGIGEPSKIATIGFGVFFPTVIAAYSACDSVPRNLIRMGQSFGLPAADIVWKIVVPGAMPGILAGFRITASIALILVVAAEMIGAQYGIGAFILSAGNLMQTDQLLAGVALLSLLGLAVSTVLGAVERAILRWR
jgi:NitT/TauT family transport system permease protein